MKIGLSIYSLVDALKNKDLTVLEAIQWISENGGKHMEIVPSCLGVPLNGDLIDKIAKKADEVKCGSLTTLFMDIGMIESKILPSVV